MASKTTSWSWQEELQVAHTYFSLSRLNDEENSRQGDILFSGLVGRHNLDLVVYYCVVANACAPSYDRAGSSSPEGLVMKRLNMKYDKYKTMYARRAGVHLLHHISFSYWRRRVSTTLQKMNACILYLATCMQNCS
jgi:hypothetical protein